VCEIMLSCFRICFESRLTGEQGKCFVIMVRNIYVLTSFNGIYHMLRI
jgi:hypothetical protein